MHNPGSSLSVLGQDAGGCGCGCDHAASAGQTAAATVLRTTKGAPMTRTYSVTGMTCGHCVGAVTSELQALDVVDSVTVDLVAGGISSVTVTSAAPLDDARVAAALDDAGDYHLTS